MGYCLPGTMSFWQETKGVQQCPLLCVLFFILGVQSFVLDGISSYARYPHWNACINASVSFEFKTEEPKGLLMYIDDGGEYDYFEVVMDNGKVRFQLNIVDGYDKGISLKVGKNLNDGRWHKLKVTRNRMETILKIDNENKSKFAFGSDYFFGDLRNNSHLFLGGIPRELKRNIHALALPSVILERSFKGSIRNVMYSNCTCQTTRVNWIDGAGIDTSKPESCNVRNPCREGCLCISKDRSAECDCSQLKCVKGKHMHLGTLKRFRERVMSRFMPHPIVFFGIKYV